MNSTRKSITLGMAFSGLTATYYKYCCQQPKLVLPKEATHFFKSRDQHLQEIIKTLQYDIVVIGGGCNGTGVLLDASTRGFKSLLIQKNDFSSGASSKSTKLIHGGVRYLQQVFAFNTDSLSSRYQKYKLVQQAITQRSYMIENAEYLTHKIPFVIPSTSIFKTAYFYAGSVVYYMIYAWYAPRGSTFFHFPTFMHKSQLRRFFPYLSDKYKTGVVYEDGSFNDSRMVIAALLTATQGNGRQMPKQFKPANILNKAQFIDFIKNQQSKKIQGVIFKDTLTGKQYKIKCKHAVNCAGAWADQVRHKVDPNLPKKLCHVGGSHITYDEKVASSKYGLTMPSKDGRVTLVVPWMGRVIAGTTQKRFDEPESNPTCSQQQRIFINQAMSDAMDKLSPQQLLKFQKTRWCGLRPLVLNGTAQNTKDISRTHFIQKDSSGLYTLIGGKWTIFRKMGEDIVDLIANQQKQKGKIYGKSMTKKLPLIGSASQIYKNQLIEDHGIVGLHLYENYGARADQILKGDLTQLIGPITISEIKYIIKNEMPTSPQDVLMRRTRSTFLLQKQKVLKMIPLICHLMKEEGLIKVSQSEMSSYIQQVANKINSYQFT